MFRKSASVLVICGLALALAGNGQTPPASADAAPVASVAPIESPPLIETTPKVAHDAAQDDSLHVAAQRPPGELLDYKMVSDVRDRVAELEAEVTRLKALLDKRTLMSQPATSEPPELFTHPQPEPAPAKATVRLAAPTGHWESYGFRGRRSRWVSDSQQQTQYANGSNYVNGGCAGGSCGVGFFGRRR